MKRIGSNDMGMEGNPMLRNWVSISKNGLPPIKEEVLIWPEAYTAPILAYVDKGLAGLFVDWYQITIEGSNIKLPEEDVAEIEYYLPKSAIDKFLKPPRYLK